MGSKIIMYKIMQEQWAHFYDKQNIREAQHFFVCFWLFPFL